MNRLGKIIAPLAINEFRTEEIREIGGLIVELKFEMNCDNIV